jgi:hypothetical protein
MLPEVNDCNGVTGAFTISRLKTFKRGGGAGALSLIWSWSILESLNEFGQRGVGQPELAALFDVGQVFEEALNDGGHRSITTGAPDTNVVVDLVVDRDRNVFSHGFFLLETA